MKLRKTLWAALTGNVTWIAPHHVNQKGLETRKRNWKKEKKKTKTAFLFL